MEKWEYIPYGRYCDDIPRDAIRYKEELENLDMIKNSNGKVLIYYEDRNIFKLMTDDPMNDELNLEDIMSNWTKY